MIAPASTVKEALEGGTERYYGLAAVVHMLSILRPKNRGVPGIEDIPIHETA